jgi:hypothetical protein
VTQPPAEPEALGPYLLRRARAHGMTGEALGVLLGLSVPQIRALTSADQLQHHPGRILRTVAERLDLPWPDWLTANADPWPEPPPPDSRQDPARVHAVLAAAIGQSMHLGEIAEVLSWTTSRVRAAADQLTARPRAGTGTRLVDADDSLTLDVVPGMLDGAAQQRLAKVLHAHGLGHDPQVFHLIHQIIRSRRRAGQLIDTAPDVLDEAVRYQVVTHDIDEDGQPDNVRLHPDVEYSLGLARDLPEHRQDRTTEDS